MFTCSLQSTSWRPLGSISLSEEVVRCVFPCTGHRKGPAASVETQQVTMATRQVHGDRAGLMSAYRLGSMASMPQHGSGR